MANTTYMLHECPVCGRRLQIRVEYLGNRVSCSHCGGTFEVTDNQTRHAAPGAHLSLLERAEQLLETPDLRGMRTREFS